LRRNNEGWEGYCSGFTASTIRHPEPVSPVDAGQVGGVPGVVFQPSDIKALLSCIYSRVEIRETFGHSIRNAGAPENSSYYASIGSPSEIRAE
jgi:hypothetical protein